MVWNNLKIFLWLTFLVGIAYPLVITIIAYMMMHTNSSGGFISVDGKQVGATLIGQKFENKKYFWGRPSNYQTLPASGSNLGPTSDQLRKVVEERNDMLTKAHKTGFEEGEFYIPSELLFTSGSGIDPHISPQAAHFQVGRIVRERVWDADKKAEINKLIDKMTTKRFLGFIGEPYVNVLQLNIALDQMH